MRDEPITQSWLYISGLLFMTLALILLTVYLWLQLWGDIWQ